MTITAGTASPCLDFGEWTVAFPNKGQHAFLTEGDLRTILEAPPPEQREGVWLFRAESGVCGIVPVLVTVSRDGVGVVGLAVLHHGQNVDIGGSRATFHEVQRITLSADSRLHGRKCPYCHDVLETPASVLRCPLCGEAYHESCWKELIGKHCCSRACRFAPDSI
jgi:hypothetical protein